MRNLETRARRLRNEQMYPIGQKPVTYMSLGRITGLLQYQTPRGFAASRGYNVTHPVEGTPVSAHAEDRPSDPTTPSKELISEFAFN